MDPYASKHARLSYGPQNPADYEREIQKMTDRYHSRYNDALFEADDEVSIHNIALMCGGGTARCCFHIVLYL